MGIPWRGCSCSSEGTRRVFQAFQGAVVPYAADRWSVYDGKIVLIVLPHLKLWWSRNLCSGNADVELRKHSWRQRGGEGRPGACTHEGWRLKQREITPGQNSVEKQFFDLTKPFAVLLKTCRRSSFILVMVIRRFSRTLGLNLGPIWRFPLKTLVQIPVLASLCTSHCNGV